MIRRILGDKISAWAEQYPVVTITGPRQSGKTTLAKALFPNKHYVSLEELDNRRFAREDPRGFLSDVREGAILDEIQNAPDLLSYLQGEVDGDDRPGRFILTGSRQFEMMERVSQSLAGRTAVARLLPLAFTETPGLTEEAEADTFLYRGFYPRIYDRQLEPSESYSFYLSTYLERDIRQIGNIGDLSLFENFLRLCAGRCGQLLNASALSNELGITHPTVRRWISILEAGHVVKLLTPWHANIGKRLVKSPKLYFIDVGLASHLLGIENAAQLKTHPQRGQLFENMIVGEALKQRFNRGLRDNLHFYRDHQGNEVDLLLEHGETCDAFEIKSARTVQAEFFRGLDAFEKATGKTRHRYLAYGGSRASRQRDTRILPWSAFSIFPETER